MAKEIKKQNEEAVGYKGTVELGIIRNGKKYKKITTNAGTMALFRYLCDCMAAKLNPNYAVNISDRPGALVIKNGTNSILSYGIMFSDLSVRENSGSNSCSTIFNFLIPGTIILGKEISTVELVSINNKNVVYATANFSKSVSVKDVDTNLYVSWTLTISNR